MIRTGKAALAGLATLGIFAAMPAMADETTEAFQLNVQRAIKTLDDMQALFTRMDARKKAQASGTATTSAPTNQQQAEAAPQPPEPAK